MEMNWAANELGYKQYGNLFACLLEPSPLRHILPASPLLIHPVPTPHYHAPAGPARQRRPTPGASSSPRRTGPSPSPCLRSARRRPIPQARPRRARRPWPRPTATLATGARTRGPSQTLSQPRGEGAARCCRPGAAGAKAGRRCGGGRWMVQERTGWCWGCGRGLSPLGRLPPLTHVLWRLLFYYIMLVLGHARESRDRPHTPPAMARAQGGP